MNKINKVLKDLKIKVSLNNPEVSCTSDNKYQLFAYTKKQAEGWSAKLTKAGYANKVYSEVGAHIVEVIL